MRTIDADEFDLYLDKRMTYEAHRNHAYLKGVRDCRKDLASVPTIEAKPVRHGKWIDREGSWECSECHEISCCNGNYCPNCGAKMDGGENG